MRRGCTTMTRRPNPKRRVGGRRDNPHHGLRCPPGRRASSWPPSSGIRRESSTWSTYPVSRKSTITGPSYAETIRKLRRAIPEKRRGKLTKKVLLLHDNAPTHTAGPAVQALCESGFAELSHPPYSPDLAPSDYYLFKHLKKDLRGRTFKTDNSLKTAVTKWINSKTSSFFLKGIEDLQSRWETCIELGGDYIRD